jgi:hypothetical protein
MTLKFDPTQPFGTIHGEHEHGAVHSQFGFLFDQEGKLVEAALDAAGKARLADHVKKQAALEQARKSLVEALGDTPEAHAAAAALNLSAPEAPEEVVDLVAWASGAKKYQWTKVVEAITAATNNKPTSKPDAMGILKEAGIFPVA